MTQFAVRIGSIVLICVAATPVVAGPRGGAPFGGGGVHFSGGGGAPHLSTPHFSAPLPFITPVGPQRFARPGHLPQSHVAPGQVGSAPLLGRPKLARAWHTASPSMMQERGRGELVSP